MALNDMTQHIEQRRKWHFDRTINIPTLMTGAVFAVSIGLYLTNMDKNQSLMQQQISNQQKQIEQMNNLLGEGGAPLRRDMERMQKDLTNIGDKLDRFILSERFPVSK